MSIKPSRRSIKSIDFFEREFRLIKSKHDRLLLVYDDLKRKVSKFDTSSEVKQALLVIDKEAEKLIDRINNVIDSGVQEFNKQYLEMRDNLIKLRMFIKEMRGD